MPAQLTDTSRLYVHTMTTKLLSLLEAIEAYVAVGSEAANVIR